MIKKIGLIPFILLLLGAGLVFVLLFPFINEYLIKFISHFGVIAVFPIVMLMDTIIQPISPDLLIFSAAFGGVKLLEVSLMGGIASCCAGVLGYYLGKRMGSERFAERFGTEHLHKGKDLFDRYGILAVIVGAFSPLPYSSVCWTAGIYGMNFRAFVTTSILTRIPRFLAMGLLGYLMGA